MNGQNAQQWLDGGIIIKINQPNHWSMALRWDGMGDGQKWNAKMRAKYNKMPSRLKGY
jgi:hypothetical protein